MELELVDVSKMFQHHHAVDHVSLCLKEGVYGLLGANGAGKTTIMRMICTLLEPSEGKILYNGENILQLGEHYRDILGYLPQKFGYYPDFSGYDFLMYIATLKGFRRKEAKLRVNEVLESVYLSNVKDKKIQTYSGGMVQRLGIAQAILNNPKIVVLDEPTSGLDPKERIRFRNIISTLSRDCIVILSTHIVSDIEYIANEILIMKKGSIVSKGSVQQILTSVQNSVFEVQVAFTEVEAYQRKYCVSNVRNEGNSVVLRLIDKDHSLTEGLAVQPTLEDVYLSEFSEDYSL